MTDENRRLSHELGKPVPKSGLSSEPQPQRPEFSKPVRYLTTPAEIDALGRTLNQLSQFAVDVEADSAYHYYEKVCLLQISADGTDYIVDPLAVPDLSPLREAFADPAKEKILHAADNDLALLLRCHQLRVETLFDTLIAAQIAGHRSYGLNNLLGHYFQVALDKRYQRHDWSSRPLGQEHMHYARCDTHFLAALRDRLWTEIEAAGREEQALEEFYLASKKEILQRPFSADNYIKIKGARNLSEQAQHVLRELFVFRDQLARSRDVPPVRVARNDVLLTLAERVPMSPQALQNVRGIPPWLARYHGDTIVSAIHRGLENRQPLQKHTAAPSRLPASYDTETRFKKLKKWREHKAREINLAAEVIAPNAILHAVAENAPKTLEALRAIPKVRAWQVQQFGAEWLAIVRL